MSVPHLAALDTTVTPISRPYGRAYSLPALRASVLSKSKGPKTNLGNSDSPQACKILMQSLPVLSVDAIFFGEINHSKNHPKHRKARHQIPRKVLENP